MSELREVVTTRDVPSLLVTSMVGRLPTAMATLGILLLIREQGGSYTVIGALTAVLTVGVAIGQPTLSRLVDRAGQRTVLLGAAAVSTVAFVVLAAVGARQPVLAVLAAAVAGLATPPLEPCLRAQWPRLITDPGRLRAIFSLDVGLQEIVFVAGPLVTVGAVALFGARAGLIGCAVTGLIGTAAFVTIRAVRDWQPEVHDDGPHGSPWQQGNLVRCFVVAFAIAVPVGTLAIVGGAFGQLRGDSDLTGWTMTVNAAGALVSGVLGAVRPIDGHRAGARTKWALLLALGYLPLALVLPTPGWLLTAAVSGLALPPALGVVFQQVGDLAPPRMLTEANAWVVTAFGVGLAAGQAVAGLLVDRIELPTSIRVVVIGAAAIAALAGVVTASGRRAGEPVRP